MALSPEQIEQYHREGYVVARGAATQATFIAMAAALDGWVEESRSHQKNYGETLIGAARFDLEPGHSAAKPRLRRINNPAEISEAFRAAAFDGPLGDMVVDLLGQDVKFLQCKINLKLPGTATRVDYHQDFAYVPYTNDSALTALVMLDDMTLENGCLMAVRGSHREGQVSLWQGGRFTGAVSADKEAECRKRAVPITGKAGDVCLMHTLLLHGSEPNTSDYPRRLFICGYSAADAFPLVRTSLPNRLQGSIVRGKPVRHARLGAGLVELPEEFHMTSFFQLQEQSARRSGG